MNNRTDYPPWIATFDRWARIGHGIVLHGIVRDVFYDPDQREYVDLAEFLSRRLLRDKSFGFTIAGKWDQIDALTFPDGKMLARFRKAADGKAQPTPSGRGQPYAAGNDGPQPKQPTQPTSLYADPADLLAATRSVIEESNERLLLILDWNQYWLSSPAPLAGDERGWLLRLAKMMRGPSPVPMDGDHLRQSPSLIVILTSDLGTLPPTLYQGEPRIHRIVVPTPSRPERKGFVLRHFDDLRVQQPKASAEAQPAIAGSSRDQIADLLADRTDRLQYADLRQLLSLSLHSETPLTAEQLIMLYRYGEHRSPWRDLSEEKVRRIEEIIRRRVIGQDAAIRHVADIVIAAFMGLSGLQHSASRCQPKGRMFFVGPTGVGKTELAKALAEYLFGEDSACIRYDMSEYKEEHNAQRLVGAPPGYVGFEAGGRLTNAIRARPFSVVLFDEIEKAHPSIFDIFLQILEDGRLTDGQGETAYFGEAVVVLTSNIGAADAPETDDPAVIHDHFVHAVEHHFNHVLGRPELLNRLGENIVVFNPIRDTSFRSAILDHKSRPIRVHLDERYGLNLMISDALKAQLVETARQEHGGRGVVNAIESNLVNPLARFLFDRLHQIRRGRTIHVDRQDGDVNFELREE
ncbi:MAG: ATPase [Deltaproteobacteria bacterium]|nr:ATPase [Deltaproteobacteria bacterium]